MPATSIPLERAGAAAWACRWSGRAAVHAIVTTMVWRMSLRDRMKGPVRGPHGFGWKLSYLRRLLRYRFRGRLLGLLDQTANQAAKGGPDAESCNKTQQAIVPAGSLPTTGAIRISAQPRS